MGNTKGRTFKLNDFLLRWGGKPRQSAEQMLTIFRALAARQGTQAEEAARVDDR